MNNEPASIGAKVAVELANRTLTSFFVPTQGLCTYQTNSLIFGLGKDTVINKVTIKYTNGKEVTVDHPQADTTIQAEKP